MSERGPASLRVVQEIAEREGVDPVDLHPPLHSVVDTEALDALFRSTSRTDRSRGEIEFRYSDYTVRVEGSGNVHVTESPPSGETNPQSATD